MNWQVTLEAILFCRAPRWELAVAWKTWQFMLVLYIVLQPPRCLEDLMAMAYWVSPRSSCCQRQHEIFICVQSFFFFPIEGLI